MYEIYIPIQLLLESLLLWFLFNIPESMVKEMKVLGSKSFRINPDLCWIIYVFQSSDVRSATNRLVCTACYPWDRIVCMFCTTARSDIAMIDVFYLAQLTKCGGCKSMLKIICNCNRGLNTLKLLSVLWYSINEDVW